MDAVQVFRSKCFALNCQQFTVHVRGKAGTSSWLLIAASLLVARADCRQQLPDLPPPPRKGTAAICSSKDQHLV